MQQVSTNAARHFLRYKGTIPQLKEYGFKLIDGKWEFEDVPMLHSTYVNQSKQIKIAMLINVDGDFIKDLRQRQAEDLPLQEWAYCGVPHHVYAFNTVTHEVNLCPEFIKQVKQNMFKQITVAGDDCASTTLSPQWQLSYVEKVAVATTMMLFDHGLVELAPYQ